jgi:hypothetical protein
MRVKAEKTYDAAYFRKWYRDPRKRIVRRAGVARKAAMAVGVAEHLLGRPLASSSTWAAERARGFRC